MGKRIRSIMLLIVLLALIYVQQTPAVYAENDVEMEGGKEEGEKEEGEKEEGEKEEEKPTARTFEVVASKPDGKHGFYMSRPDVLIRQKEQWGITRWQLSKKSSGEVCAFGSLEEAGETERLPKEAFEDGSYQLEVWMEDELGVAVETLKQVETFRIDLSAPAIQVSAPHGFDVWYQKSVTVNVTAKDAFSGVQTIQCYAGDIRVGEKQGEKGQFQIKQTSAGGKAVPVTIVAEDTAGNKAELMRSVYIDGTAPNVRITGVEEYMITSAPVSVTYEVEEENILAQAAASAEWETVQGEKKELPVPKWEAVKNGKRAVQALTEDGIYRLRVDAKDQAGYTAGQKLQIIIDQGNPVISGLEELDGTYLREFCWEQAPEELVQDFTTYTYEVYLDGSFYTFGKKVQTEGKHSLEVHAKDAAGNQAKAKAVFVIDRTAPEIMFDGVKEGETYEKERIFRILLKDAEDTIMQVQINGEKQKIHSGSKTLQYKVQEHQNYEVKVSAADKAGNQAEKSILFSVTPEKTLLQKIAEPVVKAFTGGDTVKAEEEIKPKEEKEKEELPVEGILAAAGGITAIALTARIGYHRFRNYFKNM